MTRTSDYSFSVLNKPALVSSSPTALCWIVNYACCRQLPNLSTNVQVLDLSTFYLTAGWLRYSSFDLAYSKGNKAQHCIKDDHAAHLKCFSEYPGDLLSIQSTALMRTLFLCCHLTASAIFLEGRKKKKRKKQLPNIDDFVNYFNWTQLPKQKYLHFL